MLNPHSDNRYPSEETRFHSCVQKVFTPIINNFILDVRVDGREHIPERGALILAVNHVMFYDVVPVQLAIPKRAVFFMAKEELFRNPLTSLLFRNLLAFPVQRGFGDVRAMDVARRLLDNGQVLGIFPEGTRSYGRGMGRGKSGAARLALDTGMPILPMALDGTQDFLKHFPRRTQIRVKIGSLLYPTPQERTSELTERIMLAIARMLPIQYQGHYTAR